MCLSVKKNIIIRIMMFIVEMDIERVSLLFMLSNKNIVRASPKNANNICFVRNSLLSIFSPIVFSLIVPLYGPTRN